MASQSNAHPDLASARRALLRKHPGLQEIQFSSLDRLHIDTNQLSALIESVWSADYPDEPRIRFDRDFFLHNRIDEKASMAAIRDGELVGVFLALPVRNQAMHTGVIATGLTVRKPDRGMGIAQMLYLRQLQGIIAHGYQFSLYWLDARHLSPGSSYDIFSNKGYQLQLKKVPIFCKVINCGEAFSLGLINPLERSTTAAIASFVNLMGRHTAVSPTALGLDRLRFHSRERLYLSEDQSESISASAGYQLQFVRTTGEQIKAMLFGFVNRYRDGAYFQVDGLHFAPGVGYRDKLGFVSACEAHLRQAFRCCLVIIPQSVSDERLLTFGYLPLVSQTIATHQFNRHLDVTKQFIYLR